MRILRHLLFPRWGLTRRFPAETLDAIEAGVRESEREHRGEIRFALEGALEPRDLWRTVAARDRALEVFAELEVWNTIEKNGVLIYVLLAEHDVEIVADHGLEGRVTQAEWQDVCAAMELAFRDGRWREGSLAGIGGVTRLLVREFPAGAEVNPDEQPNRPFIRGERER